MSSCNSTPVQTVEVIRLVSQTVEVTRIVPQTVIATQLVNVTTTPQPMGTPTPTLTPTPKWTSDFTGTPIRILTLTPGIQVIDNNTRAEVEKFISAQTIRDYLVMNYGIRSSGGKVFCGYTPMGMGNDGNTIKLYVYIDCVEYYLKDQVLKTGTAYDMPVVLFVEVRHGEYKIVNFLDADFLYGSVKTNFPPEIQKIINSRSTNPELFNNGVGAAKQELQKEAAIFFWEIITWRL